MKKKIVFTTLLVITMLSSSFAQLETKISDEIIGTPKLTIFGYSFWAIEPLENTTIDVGFGLSRGLIGYKVDLYNTFTAEVSVDFEDFTYSYDVPTSNYLYLRYAYVKYTSKNRQFSSAVGIHSTAMFKHQEKVWGYRYLAKTAMDKYKFGNSADLGATFSYTLFEKLTLNFSADNGTGYKHLSNTGCARLSTSVILDKINGFSAHLYIDYFDRNDVALQTYSFFTGYKKGAIRTGVEFDYQVNSGNIEGYDRYITSLFFSYEMINKWSLFARYDFIDAVVEKDVNIFIGSQGSGIISGIEYKPIKELGLAISYQPFFSSENDEENQNLLFFNLGFKL